MPAPENRVERLRAKMVEKSLDALMVCVEENRRYVSGFTGEDGHYDETAGILFITANRLLLATDSRYVEQAKAECPGWEIYCYKKGLAHALPDIVKRLSVKKLGFEPARVSVLQYRKMKESLDEAGTGVRLMPAEPLVEKLRQIKDQEEVEAIRASLRVAEKAFLDLVPSLSPDRSERDVAWELERRMRESGADSSAFPCIVASGPNAALPHAVPTRLPMGAQRPLLFDWGARINGYCSDISRTIPLGKADDTFKRVFETVARAQQKALARIRPGVSSQEVDAAAREHIRRAGFEGRFGHGLGHGVGLAVHEDPRVGPNKETTLEAGMVFTVEPGIYLPEWGGVRLENMVLVTEDGCEVLNELPVRMEAWP